ncbi:tautomerase family protein [Leeuwenhoekiella aequorea]|uniref:4-oxalocrotonate tautomerase n=1 Tax=Leeuwenhoekiella aequorea TaxID=283736 RepID=A0A4Q0P7U4_9FLAO|nr:tautomerase family protein [Leeuwenhoekiella aequorea]RXG22561.1 4-oxalocrotonate tautomerase [Leeuwenhoekiella aequorea]
MPHIVLKSFPLSEEERVAVTTALSQALQQSLGKSEASISIAIEEVSKEDWNETVYQPEILPNLEKLTKKPGYSY